MPHLKLKPYLLLSLFCFITGINSLFAQLDVIHWLPPLITDANSAGSNNLNDQRLIISTPSTNPINYNVVDGAGVTVATGTVSNSMPVDILIGKLVGGNYTSQTPGAGNILDYTEFNTKSTEGLIVSADSPVFVNLRQRSGAQGASLTAKGCSAIGTEFRVGLMRERENFGTESYRNHFVSVMATEDDTVVTFDDFKPGVVVSGGTATTEPPASGSPLTTDPISIILQAGESYAIGIHMAFYRNDGATASINDLNGSRVTSDKPIVVNSGTFLGSPTSSGARDAGFDQMASIARAGNEYVVIIGGGNPDNAIESPMIIATEDGTDVFLNGSLTPINTTPLNAGDYLYLDGEWNPDGILYTRSTKPTMMFATSGGSNSSATPGFSALPPLDIDVANSVDNIYNINQIGPAILRVVTTTGSTVTFNGNPPANGPFAVPGNLDWEVYTQNNVTGNMKVESTGPVAASVMNFQNPVGAQGYFSGYPAFKPTVTAEGLGCFPGAILTAVDPSGGLLRLLEWFYEDGTPTGVTGPVFEPTEIGNYFVRGSISATAPCPTVDSPVIVVTACPIADLELEKTVSPTIAAVGQAVTFSIKITNNGPDPAPVIEVKDIVPDGYTYVPGTITGGDNSSDATPITDGLIWTFTEIPSTMGSNERTVTFQATVNNTGNYTNTASVTTLALGDDPADNTDTAAVTIAVPSMEVSKALVGLASNGGGNFTATYTVSVQNLGNETLSNLRILDSIFDAPNTFPSGSTAIATNAIGLTANSGYNGTTSTNLLSPLNSLAPTTTGSVDVQVTFTTDGNQPYQNQATAGASGAISFLTVIEPSDNPDTTGIDDDPTPVNPNTVPKLDVTKSLSGVIDNNDGTFTASFDIVLTNIGDEPLLNLSLIDSVGSPSTFPAIGSTAIITANTNLSPNPLYNGTTDTQILDGSDRLAPAQSGTITVAVTFTPDSAGPFTNSVAAQGIGEFGSSTVNDTATADVSPPLEPEIEVFKALDSLVLDSGSGDFIATFTVTVQNTGNEPIQNLSLIDDLDAAPNDFPAGTTGSVSAASGGLTPNLSYDGVSQLDLLTGSNSLAIGASATVTMTVTFTKDTASPYRNQIQTSAQGLYSLSNELEPSDAPDTSLDDDPTVVDPEFDPQVELLKVLDGVVDNGDGTFTANYTLTVKSEGNEPIIDIILIDSVSTGDSTFPAGSTASVTSSNGLTPNPGYNGTTQTQVTDGTDRIAAGSQGTISIAVVFTPNNPGPYANDASVNAQGEFSTDPVTDDITAPLQVPVPFDPEVSLDKALDSLQDNTDGTFTANFLFTISNSGNEPLIGVQIIDNLFLAPSNFPSGSTVLVGTTTGGLTSNTSFNGTSNTNLLAGSDTLAVGASGTARIAVTFTPDGNQPFLNQATATGTGLHSSTSDNDLSNDPATAADNDPTAVSPPLQPELDVLKALDGVVDNGDGTFTGTFTISVTNTGNEILNNVQVSDAPLLVPSTLPPGTSSVALSTSSGFTINTNFNGNSNTALLSGTDSLTVGQTETIQLTLTFSPDGNEPYLNQATARGTGDASASPAGAKSDDPATGATDDGTSIGPVYDTKIEITKTLDSTVDNGGGSFTSTYTLNVTNTGNEPVDSIQITENITASPNNFPAGSTAAIISSSGLTTNPSFNGTSVPLVLTGTDALAESGSGSVVIAVTYTPTTAGPFSNQVSVTALGTKSGDSATDDSGPTVDVTPPFNAVLDVSKNLSAIVDNGDGTFLSTFTISVKNTGSEPLTNVQITDQLNAAPSPFPVSSTAVITGVTGPLTVATPAFNGQSQPNMLTGTDTLQPGAGGNITVDVSFTAVPNVDVFCNQAAGSATGQFSSSAVNQLSDDPDTAASGDATKSAPPLVSDVSITKTLSSVTDNGNGTFNALYSIIVTNTGNEILNNLQISDSISAAPSTFPAGSTASITSVTGATQISSPVYNGVGNTDLLVGTDSLSVGANATVEVTVTFTPDGNQPYLNQANATGEGASSGQSENALSDDPSTSTPNDPTTANPPLAPGLALTKSLDGVEDNTDGSFTATFTLTATNTGNEPLGNIQLVDAITAAPNTFPTGSTALATASTGGLTLNPLFDGITETNLLSGADTLAFGGSATVTVTVTFVPDGNQPYDNQVTATSIGYYSSLPTPAVSDDPATAATGDPTETVPPLNAQIYTTKSLLNLEDSGDGSFIATFRIESFNLGNDALEDFSLIDDIITAPSTFPTGSSAAITGSSAGLITNATFNGVTNTQLIAPSQTVPVGGSRYVDIAVTFIPDAARTFNNQASASAVGKATNTVTSGPSDDPINDNPSNPSADPNNATPVTPTLTPSLQLSKSFDDIVDNGDSTFTATFTISLSNNGSEPIENIVLNDALTVAPNTFPAGTVGAISSISSGLTAASPVYNGVSNTSLLDAGNTLAVGATETITVTATFTPLSGASYTNTASGNADGSFTSDSTNDTTTSVSFTPPFQPSIKLVKTLDSVTHIGGGQFTANYTITATNQGSEPLSSIQIVDSLNASPSNFPTGTLAIIDSSAGFTTNSAFNGTSDSNLLLAGNTLALGASKSVTVAVTFTPTGSQPYTNAASTSATGSFSGGTTIASSDADVSPPLVPSIDITKALSGTIDNGDGSFTSNFTLNISNNGNETLQNIQITDAIDTAPNNFPSGAIAAIINSSSGLITNTNYNGTTDSNTLTSGNSLAVGANAQVTIAVTYTPVSGDSFSNTASASGTGAASSNPANDTSDAQTVSPPLSSGLEVSKNLDSIQGLSGGAFRSTFTILVRNTGNEPLENIQVNDPLSTLPSTFPSGTTGIVTAVSSGLNAASPAYDGQAQANILSGTDSLAVGAVKTITLQVDFTPSPGIDTYLNQALGSGTGAFTTTPISEPSDDPDTAATDGDPTPSSPPFAAELDLTKALDSVVHTTGGTFIATFTITATNTGNEPLNNVQINDTISTGTGTFPAGSTAQITANNNLTPATTTPYNGVSAAAMLEGMDSLGVGISGSVTVEVTFVPDGNQPYLNQAVGNAIGASSGQEETDLSDDPATPSDPTDATTTAPPIVTAVDIEKTLGTIIDHSDGTFTAPYTIVTTNNGNEPLHNLSLTDSISGFPSGSSVAVTNVSGGLTTNPTYDGVSETELLAPGNTLTVGASATLIVNVTFTPDGNQPYANTVVANAQGLASNTATMDDSTAALANPPLNPTLDLQKTLQSVIDNGDGTFKATYQITVDNTGNEPLVAFRIDDSILTAPSTFPVGSSAQIVSASGLSTNSSYNGTTDIALLEGTDTLAISASGSVIIEVNFPPSASYPYNNQATAFTEGDHSGTSVTESDSATATPPLNPALQVTKTVNTIQDLGSGQFRGIYTISISNQGNEPVNSVQIVDNIASSFPAGSTATVSGVTGALTSNPGYNGISDTNVLAGTDSLAFNTGGSATIEITFTPTSGASYTNNASATSVGTFSNDSTTDSDTTSGETPPFQPLFNTTKTLDSVTHLANGVFVATYTITVENIGNEPINSIMITDAISVAPSTFPAGSTATISNSSIFTTNSGYNGTSDTALLAAGNTLAPTAQGSVSIEVSFTPDTNFPYNNQATSAGTGAYSTDTVTGNASAPVTPPLTPSLDIDKVLSNVVDNMDGTFTANFAITVNNDGNEVINQLQAVDAITTAPSDFPAGSTAVVSSVTSGFTANASYNGTTDTDLLAGTDSIAVGANVIINVAATYTPTSSSGHSNQASVSGSGAASTNPANDISPLALAMPTLASSLAVSKNLDIIEDLGGGTFKSIFTILIRNTGNEVINGVQLSDSLTSGSSNFPAGSTGVVTAISSNLTAASPVFDAASQPNMLDGTDSLAVNEVGSVTVEVTFTPPSGATFFVNQASGSGTGALTNQLTIQPSDDPDTADTNGDPTISAPPFAAEMNVQKALDSVTHTSGGVFVANYTITVSNTGNEPLNDVQVVDAISAAPSTFPSGSSATVTGTTNLTASSSPAYNGNTETSMLAPNNNLVVGESGTISLQVTFTPDGNQPYLNQAVGTAIGATSGLEETDQSDDPATPADPEDPTSTAPPIITSMDVEKTLGTIADNMDGSFTAPYTITLQNTGNEPLINPTLTDSLTSFPSGFTFILANPTSGLVLNTLYDGQTVTELLATGNTLAVGANETITLSVTFTPDGNQPYSNTATGAATGQYTGTSTMDDSTAAVADPPLITSTLTTKSLNSIVHIGGGSFRASYTLAATNNGNEVLNNVQITDDLSAFPTSKTIAITAVTSGFAANTSFNGDSDKNLLAVNSSLQINQTVSVTIEITFVPTTANYANSATSTGVGAVSSETAMDTNAAPLATPNLNPSLNVTKTELSTMRNADTSFTSSFEISVSNNGNELLNNVQITDNLSAAPSSFPVGFTAQIVSVSGGYPPNNSYNGSTMPTLLATPQTLAVGAEVTAVISVTYNLDGSSTYLNSASATGTGNASSNTASNQGTASATPGPIKPPTFAEWQAANPLGGNNAPLDNPDGDLTSNLAEYAFCQKPDTGLPVFPDGTTPNCGLHLSLNSMTGKVDACYFRPTTTDITYDLLHSTDGTSWDSSSAVSTTSPGPLGSTKVTYADVESLIGPESLIVVQATYDDGTTTFTANSQIVGWQPHAVLAECETFANPFISHCKFSGAGTVTPASRTIDFTASLGGGSLSGYLNPSNNYAIEIVTGTHCGHRFEIESFTATTVVLAADTDLFAANPCNTSLTIPDFSDATVTIVPMPTIDELFDPAIYQAGANASTADNIFYFDRNSQSLQSYYLLDDLAGDRWVNTSGSNVGSTSFCPTQGLFTHHRGAGFSSTQFGGVRDWKVITPLKQGYNLIAPAHPTDTNAQQRAMLSSGFAGTGNPGTADQYILWKGDSTPGDGGYDGYFYTQAGSLDQWTSVKDVNLTDISTTDHFQSDRSVFYCQRPSTGLPAYAIPSPVVAPPEQAQAN